MGETVFCKGRLGGRRLHLCCIVFIQALMVSGILLLVPPLALAQSLFVDPALSTPDEQVFTVDIAIDCAGLSVKGVETVLAFDPFLLRLDAVTPGPWFTGTGKNFYFFDYTAIKQQGIIHFASTVLEGTNDQSLTIAVCHFSVLGFGSTPVIFQDVDVRGPDNQDLGFGHSIGDLILVDPAIPVVLSSFGGVKALYR